MVERPLCRQLKTPVVSVATYEQKGVTGSIDQSTVAQGTPSKNSGEALGFYTKHLANAAIVSLKSGHQKLGRKLMRVTSVFR